MKEQMNSIETAANQPEAEAATEQVTAQTRPAALPRAMSGVGVCSILCGLFSFFFPLPALVGIGLAIHGIRRDRRDKLCYIGLCVSCAFLAFNVVKLIQVCGSPELAAIYGTASGSGVQ